MKFKFPKSKKKYELCPKTITPTVHFELGKRLEEEIFLWIKLEQKFVNKDTIDEGFLDLIAVLNLSALALDNEEWKKKVYPIFETNLVSTVKYRLIDLNTRVRYTFHTEFIDMVEGSIYKSVTDTIDPSLPTILDWKNFTDKYPFAWLLFLIQTQIRKLKFLK